jgi:hypothetical protein
MSTFIETQIGDMLQKNLIKKNYNRRFVTLKEAIQFKQHLLMDYSPLNYYSRKS